METKRHCAYCGKEKSFPTKYEERCKCAYRFGRRQKGFKGGFSVQCENISAETTLAEFIESIRKSLPASYKNPESVIGVWKWSFSSRGAAQSQQKEREEQGE